MAEPFAELRIEISGDPKELKKLEDTLRKSLSGMENQAKVSTGKTGGHFQNMQKQIGTAMARIGTVVKAGAAVFGGLVIAIGAVAAPLLLMTKNFADTADELAKLSTRSGATVEFLSSMKLALDLNDGSLQALGTGFRKLNQAMSEVITGNLTEAGKSLLALDTRFESMIKNGASAEEMFILVSDKLSQLESQSLKTDLAFQIFGRAGEELLPTLDLGAKGLEEMRKKAEELGIVIDTKSAKKAEEFNDNITILKASLSSLGYTVGKELVPELNGLVLDFTAWVGKNKELLKQDLIGFIRGAVKVAKDLAPLISAIGSSIAWTAEQVAKGNAVLDRLSKEREKGGFWGSVVSGGMIGLAGPAGGLVANSLKEEAAQRKVNEAREKGINTLMGYAGGLGITTEKGKEWAAVQYTGADAATEAGGAAETEAEILKRLQEAMGSDGAGGEADKLAETQLAMRDAIMDTISQLELQVASMGRTSLEVIELEEKELLATLATAGMNEELKTQVERISALKRELARGEVLEALRQEVERTRAQIKADFEAVVESVTSEINKIGKSMNEALLTISKAHSQGLIDFERAEELRVKIVEQASEQIVDIQRQEAIKRLKESDNLLDQFKGIFAEMVLTVQEDTGFMSEFVADTFGAIRDTISDTIYNAIKGDFDSLKDLWKATLDAMLQSFIQFISAVLTQQIILNIVPNVDGLLGIKGQKGGAAGAGAGLFSDVTGLGGMLGLGSSGLFGSSGTFTALGALFSGNSAVGFGQTLLGAIPAIGMILTAVFTAVSVILPIFKKTPHYAFEFDSIKEDGIKRAVTVAELLDPDLFMDEIFRTLSSHGGKGAFSGKEREDLKRAIHETIVNTIGGIQAIINQLPADMAEMLNEALMASVVDMDSKIGRSSLLGFDAKGAKEIKERLQKFFEGDLQGRVIFAVRDFLQFTFESLGAIPEKAREYLDAEFEKFQNASSPEERAQIGADVLAQTQAIVDAYNIASGEVNDSFSAMMQAAQSLSKELGYDAIPSIDELKNKVKEMIANFEVTPETIAQVKELRAAIMGLTIGLSQSIRGLVQQIEGLNQKIVELGGTAIDVSGSLTSSIDALMGLYAQEGISLEERQGILTEIEANVDAWVNSQIQAQQAMNQQAINAINSQISALQSQKSAIQSAAQEQIAAIQKTHQAVLESKNEELEGVRALEQVYKSIKDNIQSLLLGSQSPENPFQRLQRAQMEVQRLFGRVGSASGTERAEIASQVQELLNTGLGIGAEAFQSPDPEFRAIFNETIKQLEELAKMVEPAKSSEQIQEEIRIITEDMEAEIELMQRRTEAQLAGIDSRIQAAQDRIASLQAQSNQLSAEAKAQALAYYEFVRDELKKILDERLKMLAELGVGNLDILESSDAIALEQLVTLRQIRDSLAGVIPAQHGFAGRVNKPTLFLAGERGEEQVNITPIAELGSRAQMSQTVRNNFSFSFVIEGNVDSDKRVEEIAEKVIQKIQFDTASLRQLRRAI